MPRGRSEAGLPRVRISTLNSSLKREICSCDTKQEGPTFPSGWRGVSWVGLQDLRLDPCEVGRIIKELWLRRRDFEEHHCPLVLFKKTCWARRALLRFHLPFQVSNSTEDQGQSDFAVAPFQIEIRDVKGTSFEACFNFWEEWRVVSLDAVQPRHHSVRWRVL